MDSTTQTILQFLGVDYATAVALVGVVYVLTNALKKYLGHTDTSVRTLAAVVSLAVALVYTLHGNHGAPLTVQIFMRILSLATAVAFLAITSGKVVAWVPDNRPKPPCAPTIDTTEETSDAQKSN